MPKGRRRSRAGAVFDAYSKDSGAWKKEDATLTFTPNGNFYRMSDGKIRHLSCSSISATNGMPRNIVRNRLLFLWYG